MTPGGFLGADPCIDCLVRNPTPPIVREVVVRAARDLIGRPSPPQSFTDVASHLGPLHFRRPRAFAPASPGLPVSGDGPNVHRIGHRHQHPQFAGNGAFAPAEPVGDLHLHFPVLVHVGYDLAFFQGKMTSHRRDSFQLECSVKRPLKHPCDVFTYISFSDSVAFQL